ncbi:hypothetical protein K9L67_01890 [Candidatus Woesearchaeota archaeon]|nr:hypothetical protein [Candidatus Woesearchaeota archaeon]MCF7900955.1 hypothetical protein [Candidatus Woesearchaeota archaeon]MCF8013599.1 hypothetical protein [Candidatus Woesearchaeota archaeon]
MDYIDLVACVANKNGVYEGKVDVLWGLESDGKQDFLESMENAYFSSNYIDGDFYVNVEGKQIYAGTDFNLGDEEEWDCFSTEVEKDYLETKNSEIIFSFEINSKQTVDELVFDNKNKLTYYYSDEASEEPEDEVEEDLGVDKFEIGNLKLMEPIQEGVLLPDDLFGLRNYHTAISEKSISYHDEITWDDGSFEFKTSLYDEDFEEDPALTLQDKSLRYKLIFDDELDVNEISSETPLELNFLGKTMHIIDAKNENIDGAYGWKIKLQEGDQVEINDQIVTLSKIGYGVVKVVVNNKTKVISEGESEDFGDLDVYIVTGSVSFIEGSENNKATLIIGKDLNADTKDPAVELGESSSISDAEWLWDISLSKGSEQYIAIVNNQDRDELDNDFPALQEGDYFSLPDYIGFRYHDTYGFSDMNYINIEVSDSLDLSEGNNGNELNNAKGVYFSSDSRDDVFIVNSVATSEVYVVDNQGMTEIWYESGSDEIKSAESTFQIIGNDHIRITPPKNGVAGLDGSLNDKDNFYQITFDETDDALWFYADADKDFFGVYDDEESDELKYADFADWSKALSIGTADYDVLTNYGAIINVPEEQLGSGSELELLIPFTPVSGTIVVEY